MFSFFDWFKKKKKLGIYCISSRETYYSPNYPPTLFVICTEQDSKFISCDHLIADKNRRFRMQKETAAQNNNVTKLADSLDNDEGRVLMIYGKMKVICYELENF